MAVAIKREERMEPAVSGHSPRQNYTGLASAQAVELWKLAAFAAVLAATFLRAPSILLEPRFWAEEGTLYFRNAFNHSFWEGLFFVPKRTAGYFALSANLPTTLAAWAVPLKYAPAVTTYFSLMVQLIPFAIILWGKSFVWETRLQKILACASLLFAATASGEAWLNTINLQVYCGIISLILLGEDLSEASGKKLTLYGAIQAFCALSGVYSTFLFFAFAIKLYQYPSKGSWMQAAISFCCAVIQTAVFIYLQLSQQISSKKFSDDFPWADVIPNSFYFHFALPILGHEHANSLASFLGFSPSSVHLLSKPEQQVVILSCAAIMLSLVILVAALKRAPLRLPLLVGFLTVTLLTTASAVAATPGGRYAVFPGAFILLLLLAESPGKFISVRNSAFIGLIAVSLWQGSRYFYHQESYWDCHEACPHWSEEISKWEQDASYLPQVWPIHVNKPEVKWLIRLIPRTGDSDT